jgi:Protein of unknown function (DUF4239)
MILWIESQDIAVITLIVFALCYAIAAIIFAAAIIVSRRRIATDLKATTPVMLTPLSVITGLLIAFLASRVWSNVDRANAYVAQEASAISQVVLLTDALPEDPRKAVRDGLRKYLQFIKAEDWPAMLSGHASFQPLPPGLTDAVAALLSFAPSQPGQHVVQNRAVEALEQALEARRNRVLLSGAVIAPVQWLVIFLLDALALITIGMVHLDRRATAAVNMFVFSTAIAASVALLMINDRPFSAGGFTVEPTALQHLQID